MRMICRAVSSGLIVFLGCASAYSAEPASATPPLEWIEPATGHRVIRLSTEAGTRSMYFHQNSVTPDGRFVITEGTAGIVAIEIATRKNELIVPGKVRALFVGRKSGLVYFSTQRRRRRLRATHRNHHLHGAGDRWRTAAHRTNRPRLHRLGQRRRNPAAWRLRRAPLATRTGTARPALRRQLRGHRQGRQAADLRRSQGSAAAAARAGAHSDGHVHGEHQRPANRRSFTAPPTG